MFKPPKVKALVDAARDVVQGAREDIYTPGCTCGACMRRARLADALAAFLEWYDQCPYCRGKGQVFDTELVGVVQEQSSPATQCRHCTGTGKED